ncbi:MAG: rhodanese-like domain-containing protein [Burkholderiales bacterium]
MRTLSWLLALALGAPVGSAAADEAADFGVAPTRELRLSDHAAPTPREVPGAKTILTPQLRAWLERDPPMRPLLLDVIGDRGHDSIPGAVWLPGAGRGQSFDDAVQAQLGRTLELLTRRDTRRPLVFFCAGAKCWLSYNAALRAAALGYSEVYWYRGGIEAWVVAGGKLAPMRVAWRKPGEE